MGSLHHRFPPNRNPKPRCAPRRRGFSFDGDQQKKPGIQGDNRASAYCGTLARGPNKVGRAIPLTPGSSSRFKSSEPLVAITTAEKASSIAGAMSGAVGEPWRRPFPIRFQVVPQIGLDFEHAIELDASVPRLQPVDRRPHLCQIGIGGEFGGTCGYPP
jgi:hypothetical protein